MRETVCCLLLALCTALHCTAQSLPDSIDSPADSLANAIRARFAPHDEPLDTAGILDSIPLAALHVPELPDRKRDHWTPDPIRSMWIGLVFPGGGQIYNRKYWKLPIFYGGFLGCMYALTWNNMMLSDYSQAYLDIMDSDPNTQSYMKMLPLGYNMAGKEERFKTIFKNKKDYYRKYRDMSILAFIAVYALSVVDAYVDAELSTFDISPDLSLHLEPAVIDNGVKFPNQRSPKSFGLQCNLTF